MLFCALFIQSSLANSSKKFKSIKVRTKIALFLRRKKFCQIISYKIANIDNLCKSFVIINSVGKNAIAEIADWCTIKPLRQNDGAKGEKSLGKWGIFIIFLLIL